MKNLNVKNYHLYVEVSLLIVGVLIILFFNKPIRYLGVAFIASALGFYYFSSFFKLNDGTNDRNFRSRTRDQIFKYQHK